MGNEGSAAADKQREGAKGEKMWRESTDFGAEVRFGTPYQLPTFSDEVG
jgi:hypothetical protein